MVVDYFLGIGLACYLLIGGGTNHFPNTYYCINPMTKNVCLILGAIALTGSLMAQDAPKPTSTEESSSRTTTVPPVKLRGSEGSVSSKDEARIPLQNYTGKRGCPTPISDKKAKDFGEKAMELLFEKKRVELLKSLTEGQCITTGQISYIANYVFTAPGPRLEFIKNSYASTCDLDNFPKLIGLVSGNDTKKKEFEAFLKEKNQ